MFLIVIIAMWNIVLGKGASHIFTEINYISIENCCRLKSHSCLELDWLFYRLSSVYNISSNTRTKRREFYNVWNNVHKSWHFYNFVMFLGNLAKLISDWLTTYHEFINFKIVLFICSSILEVNDVKDYIYG